LDRLGFFLFGFPGFYFLFFIYLFCARVQAIAAFLIVWWAVGAAVNTSRSGPFRDTGTANG
jgi:hypothetical protein